MLLGKIIRIGSALGNVGVDEQGVVEKPTLDGAMRYNRLYATIRDEDGGTITGSLLGGHYAQDEESRYPRSTSGCMSVVFWAKACGITINAEKRDLMLEPKTPNEQAEAMAIATAIFATMCERRGRLLGRDCTFEEGDEGPNGERNAHSLRLGGMAEHEAVEGASELLALHGIVLDDDAGESMAVPVEQPVAAQAADDDGDAPWG